MSVPIDPFKINEAVLDLWRCYIVERDMAKELEAEVARLKAEVEKWEKNTQLMGRQLNDELEQNARLKAEVERLTKAGDAMASPLSKGAMMAFGYALAKAWHAAKQGGQP